MYKKDYLQRQFEAFGKAMAMLANKRRNKELNDYEKEFFSTFLTYTSLTPEQIESLSHEDFVNHLNNDVQLSSNQQHMLADLLYEKLQLYLELEEHTKADQIKTMCIFLYNKILNDDSEHEYNLEVHYRLSFLQQLDKKSIN